MRPSLRRIIQLLSLGVFLWLFLYVAWPYEEVFSGDVLKRKEWLPAEIFLSLDPLVGLSTALAGRCWNAVLWGTLAMLLASIALPRAFCGYVCPLGTLIDGFDWLIGRRMRRLRIAGIGRWRHLRYYVLAAVLVASACGVLLSGYVSAIPVLTRGLMFTVGRLQLGLMKNWGMAGHAGPAVWASVVLFAVIFLLGLLSPRFWCRYVCPSGAVFSLFNVARLTERNRSSQCNGCGRCAKVCPFDAIDKNYDARGLECTFCRTCGGACPVGAIEFEIRVSRSTGGPPVENSGNAHGRAAHATLAPPSLSRRGLITVAACGIAGAAATRWVPAAANAKPLRPPGALPERQFLQLCIRCGECFKVCPGSVLQPAGLEAGLDSLWTPIAVPSHAGCHQDCNFCTQVCPTQAIRPLTIEQKRKTPMGLAIIDPAKCLPHRGERDCRLCFDECEAAGYHAIQLRQIELKIGDVPAGALSQVQLEEMSHINAPFIDVSACIGCGLCEYRCHSAVVKQQKLLGSSAVVIRGIDRK